MPVRATKRGADRTPLSGRWDVIVCGASFAGLAVARELRASGASVLVLDRYEIGERQTSACAAPTELLEHMGLEGSILQRFDTLLVKTPRVRARWPLPFSFSTFDYRELCRLLWAQAGDAVFETAKVERRERRGSDHVIVTDRGELTAPLVVDALGWRRVLSNGTPIQPPDAALSRGLEVHPEGQADDLELFIDDRYVSPGYSWSFPADHEVRVGVGSFDPTVHVKQPTVQLVDDLGRTPDGYQGNWIPHRLRPVIEDGVFFAGDSAGHCLPLTAEGIRPALVMGAVLGRELAAVVAGDREPAQAARAYARASDAMGWKFESMYRVQQSIRHLHGRPLDRMARTFARRRLALWTFRHYLRICPPALALPAPPPAPAGRSQREVAATG